MKTIMFLIITLFCTNLSAQLGKFDLSVEYTLGFSKTTEHLSIFSNPGFHSSGNWFFKGGYDLSKRINLTLGAGYLVTKEYQRLLFNFIPEDDLSESLISHQYFVIPAGFKYKMGAFYINPEVGLAFQDKHIAEITSFDVGPNSLSSSRITVDQSSFGYHRITVPVFLSFGTEFDLGSVQMLFGVKSYYSLNAMSDIFTQTGHYYGVGVMTGVKF